MNPHPADPCVTVVPGTPAQQLAATGVDTAPALWLLVAAVVVIAVGVVFLLRGRRRRTLATASTVGALALLLSLAIVPLDTAPSHAATDVSSCSLLTVTDVRRGDPAVTGNLLPGQQVQVLSVVVTNATRMPIHLRGALEPTAGPSDVFLASLTVGSTATAFDQLSFRPSTAPVAVAPGGQVAVEVWVEVAADADRPGAISTFDTVFTATAD